MERAQWPRGSNALCVVRKSPTSAADGARTGGGAAEAPQGAFTRLLWGEESPVDQAGVSFLREARARTTSAGGPPTPNTDLRREAELTAGTPDTNFATRESPEPTSSATPVRGRFPRSHNA